MAKKIAILAADGYEDMELWYPRLRLLEAGFDVVVAASDLKDRASKHGYMTDIESATADLRTDDFAAVIIPGGIKGAENIRMDPAAVRFVRRMHDEGKVVASICHGAWVLISAIIVKGKKLTCYRGMKDDLIAAGALYQDTEVLSDGNLISSRKPADLPAFMKEILKQLA
jgi:protease I